jgi:peptidoglycan/xylan/chitin deacetylase (PgdA/CDA1 family)
MPPTSEQINRENPSWVFTYHEIHESSSRYLYRVTKPQFTEHLAFLCGLKGDRGPTCVPEITFDDGHSSNYSEAFPILEEFGIKATFFVVAGRVGRDREFMTWQQARELVAAGHQVQSHGWMHRLLTLCNAEDLHEELVASKRELEDRLGANVLSLSAPGGRWNSKVVTACAKAGYTRLFHSNPWTPARFDDGVHTRGRYMVTGRMRRAELANFLRISPSRAHYQRTKYMLKEQIRIVLGDRFYHSLWIRLAGWNSNDGIQLDVHQSKDRGDM